jgi:hypothetical protein
MPLSKLLGPRCLTLLLVLVVTASIVPVVVRLQRLENIRGREDANADVGRAFRIHVGMTLDKVTETFGEKGVCIGRMPPGHNYHYKWEMRAGSAYVLFDETGRVTNGLTGKPVDYIPRPRPRGLVQRLLSDLGWAE